MSAITVCLDKESKRGVITTEHDVRIVPTSITLVGSEITDHHSALIHRKKELQFTSLWEEIFPAKYPLP